MAILTTLTFTEHAVYVSLTSPLNFEGFEEGVQPLICVQGAHVLEDWIEGFLVEVLEVGDREWFIHAACWVAEQDDVVWGG